jgi:hypothetical protein
MHKVECKTVRQRQQPRITRRHAISDVGFVQSCFMELYQNHQHHSTPERAPIGTTCAGDDADVNIAQDRGVPPRAVFVFFTAVFLLQYAADVREALEDAGLYDFPDDSFNVALSTYQDQDLSDPVPLRGWGEGRTVSLPV